MQDSLQTLLPLFLSPEHPCAYLPDKTARTIFLDSQTAPQKHLYRLLLQQGFRRSGAYFYRPSCAHCHACVPLRIPVRDFVPDRNQKRTWRHNQDLEVRLLAAQFQPEHFDLYDRYMAWKHSGGGMDESSPEDYASFLMGNGNDTLLVEMRLQGRLMAVAVMDVIENALSAVYTFYAPAASRRSLGSFAILWEISEARRRGFDWLYLGYWVAGSRKMAYKNRFRPFEQLTCNGWKRTTSNADELNLKPDSGRICAP